MVLCSLCLFAFLYTLERLSGWHVSTTNIYDSKITKYINVMTTQHLSVISVKYKLFNTNCQFSLDLRPLTYYEIIANALQNTRNST